MKNKVIGVVCSLLLAISVLSFIPDNQLPPNSPTLIQERADEKAKFDKDQILYNDRENTKIRAKDLVKKDTVRQDQEEKNVQELQDKNKGQILIKF